MQHSYRSATFPIHLMHSPTTVVCVGKMQVDVFALQQTPFMVNVGFQNLCNFALCSPSATIAARLQSFYGRHDLVFL